ncbi:MAG: hypothetical protein WBF42_19465 [Terracidiphilus sp.]
MNPSVYPEILVADRLWIATALLHRQYPRQPAFSRDEIRAKLAEVGLLDAAREGAINAHLKQHCVANVPPSSGKYRMLIEVTPGKLRLYRPGDWSHPARMQPRKPSKSVPNREEIPNSYWPLLDWYATWSAAARSSPTERPAANNWDDDALIRLAGSGRQVWADEHADAYVENLRKEIA